MVLQAYMPGVQTMTISTFSDFAAYLKTEFSLANSPKESDSLFDDLGFDSLSVLILVSDLESNCPGIVINENEDYPDIRTAGQAYEWLRMRLLVSG
jgi:acyl carrier protein